MARRNRRVSTAFKAEQQHLRSLPVHDSSTYSEHTLRVSRTSTIVLKRVTYTVPSRLIGSRLTVRLFDARLELWCAGVQTLTLTRIHTKGMQRQRSVNYHHVIESLVKNLVPSAMPSGGMTCSPATITDVSGSTSMTP